jgi:hypothetical protein
MWSYIKKMKYCKKCGWKLEYIPYSFIEQIKEIKGEGERRGIWKCPKCDKIKVN